MSSTSEETNSRKFRLAVVGAGVFAEANHYPSLSSHGLAPLIERVAICDQRLDRAKDMAERYGWKQTYSNLDDLLANEELDGVVVCVGGAAHPELVIQVLEHGLPVFVDKPASIDLRGTELMSQASKRAKRPVQVGHQKRHGTAYRRFREIVANKETFGELVQVESKQHGFDVFPTFYTCMLEWQCHNLDFVRAVGGEVVEMEAKAHLVNEREGALTALLRFESGAVATLGWGTFGGPGANCERVEAIGTRGKGAVVRNGRDVFLYDDVSSTSWTTDWNPISANQSHVVNGYVPQLRHFVESIRAGREPEPSIHDEVSTMRLLRDIAVHAGIPLDWAPVASAP